MKDTHLQTDTILTFFQEAGCFKRGHSCFYDNQHGNGWVDILPLMQNPTKLQHVADAMATLIIRKIGKPSIIISPAISGSIFGAFVAARLEVPFAVTKGKKDEVTFHRRYQPAISDNVAFVEDIIYSGTDARANLAFLRLYGFKNITTFSLMSRQIGEIDTSNVFSLVTSPFELYTSTDCPLCASGERVQYPSARE